MINIESRFPQGIIGAIAATSLALGAAAEEYTHKALFAPNTDYPYFQSNSFPNSPNKDAFDLQVAGFLAEASLLVYVKDPKFIETTLDQAGFSKTLFFENQGTYAYLAISDSDLILVFRGSETADKTDYTTDAKIIQMPYKDFGSAHSGFVEAVGWVSEPIDKEINQLLEEKPRSLWITGHSLGELWPRYMECTEATKALLFTRSEPPGSAESFWQKKVTKGSDSIGWLTTMISYPACPLPLSTNTSVPYISLLPMESL